MRDLFLTALLFPTTVAVITNEDLTFWEKMLERWGIGLVGMALFLALAYLTVKRENKLEKERLARELETSTAMTALSTRNNELLEAHHSLMSNHTIRLERLVRDGNLSREQHSAALRMLVRKMGKLPCVPDLTEQDIEEHINPKQIKDDE